MKAPRWRHEYVWKTFGSVADHEIIPRHDIPIGKVMLVECFMAHQAEHLAPSIQSHVLQKIPHYLWLQGFLHP